MLVKAYAKINLSLNVIGKRKDGYHLLKMIMQNIDLYDDINVKKRLNGINIKSNNENIPLGEKNIVYKAAKLFKDTYHINGGVDIHIVKNIPIAAGLAGGSTDAAAVLRCMRDLYIPDLTNEELMKIGVKIGADVPYCIVGGTALCEGIGEIVTSIKSFKNKIIVIVKPSFEVSTKKVYESLNINKINQSIDINKIIEGIYNNDLNFISKNMYNVLEDVTINEHNILKKIKSDMINMKALGALMSGSGPTIFGFFEDMLKAQKCYDFFNQRFNEVYITRTV